MKENITLSGVSCDTRNGHRIFAASNIGDLPEREPEKTVSKISVYSRDAENREFPVRNGNEANDAVRGFYNRFVCYISGRLM